MDTNKIKQFVADHRSELIATTVVIEGFVLLILGCKRRSKRRGARPNGTFKPRDIKIPNGLKVWNTTDLWHEGKYLNGIVQNIPVDDLGELGKQFIKNGLARPGDIAGVVISISKEK